MCYIVVYSITPYHAYLLRTKFSTAVGTWASAPCTARADRASMHAFMPYELVFIRARGWRAPTMHGLQVPTLHPPQNGQKWSAEKFKDMSGHQGEQAQHAG